MVHWYANGHGTVEASDLGLTPGVFPPVLEVDGLRLQRSGAIIQAGEVKVVNYFTDDFRVVEVWND
jgi:hypothetical protein